MTVKHIIVKPVLDLTTPLDAYYASLLSSLSVFAMALTMVIRQRRNIKLNIKLKIAIPITAGSIIGGIAGNFIFSAVQEIGAGTLEIGQSVLMMLVMGILLLHQIYKSKIKHMHWQSVPTFLIMGTALGIIATFLGIGGGPLNLSSLNFFAAISLQGAALYSVFIIVFAQGASLLRWGLAGVTETGAWGWPAVAAHLVAAVIIGSTIGSLIGSGIYNKIKASERFNSENVLRWIYIAVLILVLVLSMVNLFVI